MCIFPEAASVARAWTANFDALPFVNKTIETYMRDCCSMNASGLAEWPDALSFVLIFILTREIPFYFFMVLALRHLFKAFQNDIIIAISYVHFFLG